MPDRSPPSLPSVPSYCDNRLDRAALRRGDDAWLTRQRARPDAAFVLISGDRPIVAVLDETLAIRHDRALAARLGVGDDENALLGLEPVEAGERPVFAALVRAGLDEIESNVEAAAEPGLKAIDLRSLALQGVLGPGDLGLLAQARSLTHWHASHRFCARCGTATQMAQAGYRRDCPSCHGFHFPRTDPVVIMLIADGAQCLMGRPPRLAEGVFTTLAGFMEPGETIEQAVRREVLEESGIRVGEVTYRASQPWPFPASLMIGCHGTALSREIVLEDDELEACRWFDRDEVRTMLAGRHPEGLKVPPPISIAHWLIRDWVEGPS